MQVTYQEGHFFHCSRQFLKSPILLPFSASADFCFTSSTSAKISLWGFFPSRETNKQKNVTRAEMGKTGRVENRGHAILVKTCWTRSVVWASALVNHPSWNVQMCWKSFQKKLTEAECSLSQHASWYTDTNGFLEHSTSRGSLYYKRPTFQKIILFWGGVTTS